MIELVVTSKPVHNKRYADTYELVLVFEDVKESFFFESVRDEKDDIIKAIELVIDLMTNIKNWYDDTRTEYLHSNPRYSLDLFRPKSKTEYSNLVNFCYVNWPYSESACGSYYDKVLTDFQVIYHDMSFNPYHVDVTIH